jgi:hypothetical protein
MKNMSDYQNTNPPTADTPNGTFKNESQPNANDGTDIKAEHLQDVYYAIYQILQLAGEIPNGELENGNLSKQFIRCLTNIGWFKYDSSIAYKKNSVIINTINNITRIYRSQKDNNTDPLPDVNSSNNTNNIINNNPSNKTNNTTNNDSWVNIITINENNTIVFNTMANDNTGVFMGSFMYGLRQDTPNGWLRCDGSEYPASSYQNFVDQYIATGEIPSKTLTAYNTELNNSNSNCGYFGYDEANNILRVPKLDDRVFIAQALSSGNICKYNQDQIVNITGGFSADNSSWKPSGLYGAFYSRGAFYGYNGGNHGGNTEGIPGFDASRVVNTGDRVQPRHIQYPLFICVSNQSQPITEDNVNLFIEGLSNKASIDGSNVTEDFFNNAVFEDNTIDYIIKTHKDGESWYRKYKSRWIEQGGIVTTTGATRTINLIIPFSSADYDVQLTPVNYSSAMYQLIVNSRQTDKFTVTGTSTGGNNAPFKWSARGI